MDTGLVALIITLTVIAAAILTKKCAECLFAGSCVAAVFAFGKHFFIELIRIIITQVSSHTWLWLLCGLFGSLAALFEKVNATGEFSGFVSKFCKTDRKCCLTALLLGIIIFIDDYLNVLTVGLCMKKSFDERKIPRQALAYIVDCTGTPVCTLIPLSSWAAFYGAFFMQYSCVSDNYKSPISAYTALIPYLFYPALTLLILFLFCMGLFPKTGRMKKAFDRAADCRHMECKSLNSLGSDDVFEKNNTSSGNSCNGTIYYFLVPMIILVAVSIAADEIIAGIIAGIISCFCLYVPLKKIKTGDFSKTVIDGFASMTGVIALLTICYTFADITSQMGIAGCMVNIFSTFLSAKTVPLVCFAISAFLSFSTGTVWGTSAIIVPMLMPVIRSTGANLLPSMAAFVSGGIFGAQACVYADTTVLSANSCDISNTEHAFSQMPYICIAAFLSAIGYAAIG